MIKTNGHQMNVKNQSAMETGKPSVPDYLMIMGKRMMTVLIGFSRQSTIHSLSHLAQARNIKQRMFWMIIALSASIGFLINLVNIIEKYYERPVLTNIYHDHRAFAFPDITFCLVNPIYFPPVGTSQYLELERKFALYYKFKNSSQLKSRHEALPFMTYKNYSLHIDLSDYLFIQPELQYGHPAWSAILVCKYMQLECKWNHFEVRNVWPHGNCFTLNVTRISEIASRDVTNMIKNAWRPDFKVIVNKALTPTSRFSVDPFNNLNTPSGVLVMVHEADTYPYPDEGFIVDSYTQIDLKITTKVHLNVNNKCDVHRSTFEYFDFRSKQSATFAGRQPDCIFNMIQSEVATRCLCLLHNMPVPKRYQHLPFCLSIEINSTLHSIELDMNECIKDSFKLVDQSLVNKKCHRDLCSHPSYTTVVSHSKYPAVKERQTQFLWLEKLANLELFQMKHFNRSDLYLKALKPQLVKDYNISSLADAIAIQKKNPRVHFLQESYVDRNFMQIRVVPSSLFMDHIEETLEYTLSRLLGDIGGCIGLWIGASLITIFEFVDLIFRIGDLLSSYRYRPVIKTWEDNKISNTANPGHKFNRFLNKFQILSENETGDLEDEINLTLLQPISLIKGSRTFFYKHMCLEDL